MSNLSWHDITGIGLTVFFVVWMLWKGLTGSLPRKPRRIETQTLRDSILEGVEHCTQSVADTERKIEQLKKLTRLAQRSGDPELMQETLMMVSEEVEHLENEKERLAYFTKLHNDCLKDET